MTKEISVEDDIREALSAISATDVTDNEPADDDAEIEGDVIGEPEEAAENAEVKEIEAPAVTEVKIDPPVSLSGSIKAKWHELPDDVKAEWKKREDDIHRMMTAKEGELNLGRSVKEIAAPYEAIIRAEGGTVEGAFKDLLNTAYVLRTGSPQQKAQLIMMTAKQYGVDLGQHIAQQSQNPLSAIQQEIQALRQQADPNRIKSQLQEEMERDRINSEIEAFAANPSNVHFNTVKSAMGSLIAAGRAKSPPGC